MSTDAKYSLNMPFRVKFHEINPPSCFRITRGGSFYVCFHTSSFCKNIEAFPHPPVQNITPLPSKHHTGHTCKIFAIYAPLYWFYEINPPPCISITRGGGGFYICFYTSCCLRKYWGIPSPAKSNHHPSTFWHTIHRLELGRKKLWETPRLPRWLSLRHLMWMLHLPIKVASFICAKHNDFSF